MLLARFGVYLLIRPWIIGGLAVVCSVLLAEHQAEARGGYHQVGRRLNVGRRARMRAGSSEDSEGSQSPKTQGTGLRAQSLAESGSGRFYLPAFRK
jgi:hypothetical protein